MKAIIFFVAALSIIFLANVQDDSRNISIIQEKGKHWLERSVTMPVKVVHHSTRETKDGGMVCYRMIYDTHTTVICLSWDGSKIVVLDDYNI